MHFVAPGPSYRAEGMRRVGYLDAPGGPLFKLALQRVGPRWYLYGAHFWSSQTSVIDVTDPATPTVVATIAGPPNTAMWQVQVADDTLVQGLEVRPEVWGGNPDAGFDEGVRLFDVTDPLAPRLLSHWRTGAHGVHRNHYTGGRHLHVAASQPGFDGNIYIVLDIGERESLVEVGRWFFPSQYTGAGPPAPPRISLHGPAYLAGDVAFLPYGAAGLVVLDVSRLERPRLLGRLEQGPAFSSAVAMHSAVPRLRRDLVIVNTEAIAERSAEPMNFVGAVDVSDLTKPRLISLFPVPVPPSGVDYPNFQTRGGRFGPHNQHHPQDDPGTLLDDDDMVFVTWFNAGLRVYDIGDPYLPREVAWFLADDPVRRWGPLPRDLVTQAEDVLVDSRGYVYLSDKNHGLQVLELTDLVVRSPAPDCPRTP